jgi:hypothetical protein
MTTASTPSSHDRAITAICDAVMRRFAVVTRTIPADSPLGQAKARLGADRFLDVAVKAMRANICKALTGDGAAWARDAIATMGNLGATTVVVGIVSDSITDIIAAAK